MRYDVVLIDQANLAHRVYHTAGDLSTIIDGVEEPIGMVYGFLRSAIKVFEEIATRDAQFIVCDEDFPVHRRAIWSGYKAERTPHSESYDRQRAILRGLLGRLGWVRAWADGWEADDVTATLANVFEADGKKVAIVTADHDSHQCVTERVHVVDPNAKKHDLQDGVAWRLRDVRKLWGVDPHIIPHVKALSGDGDEYPGAWKIGETRATHLIQIHGDLDGVLEHAARESKFEVMSSGKIHRIKTDDVRHQAPELRVFLDLATVRRDVDVQFDVGEPEDPTNVFREFKFASLLAPSTLRLTKAMAGG